MSKTANISSILLDNAIREFAKLPGIGRKSAMRMALYVLKQSKEDIEAFSNAIVSLRNEITYCKKCHNISDTEMCQICSNPKRDASTLCVVENIKDVLSVENTQQYNGLYHVLGGIISPMEGVGPSDLQIDSLVERCKSGEVKEVILALSPTMDGDTTCFYLFKKLSAIDFNNVTTIARGVAIGDELEYADEITLGRSIIYRTPYKIN